MTAAEAILEYKAIKSTAGFRLLDDRLVARVSGDDRISFMHGMCTADIKKLSPGSVAAALFLTERAHVIADCFIYSLETTFWMECDRKTWPTVRAHLERLLVADDVELEELASLAVLDIEGPAAREALGAVFQGAATSFEPCRHVQGDHLRIANLPRYGEPAFSVIGEATHIAAAVDQIKNSRHVREVSAETLNIIRIENGIARVGTDTDQRTLALEARFEQAIALNKGCYIGQETIERATARGALKRRLYGLRIIGDEVPLCGALIKVDGKEVGRLSSVTQSPGYGIIGIAILHHSAWSKGCRVSISDETGTVAGTVCELPFAI
jgi:folate-binding protein YgfZ